MKWSFYYLVFHAEPFAKWLSLSLALKNGISQDLSDFPPEGNIYRVCQRSRTADAVALQHFTS